MRTFEITIDENISDSNLLQILMSIKGVQLVKEKSDTGLTSKEWVRGGKLATKEQIQQSVSEAESSSQFFTTEQLRVSLQEKYKGE